MTQIYTLNQIKDALEKISLTQAISNGFIAYSNKKVVVPPVGELVFDDPPGDTHIKYGYIKNQETYVIKIASGFYNNPELGFSSSSGLMLVFSQKTGFLKAILLDEGHLTNVRTAVAGQICASIIAPDTIVGIGVLGTGIQARMQVDYLKSVTDCKTIHVWGRTQKGVQAYQKDMQAKGYQVTPKDTPGDVAACSNLIITTTPSKTPLLFADDIVPGTHITAMGSDTDSKQELSTRILSMADMVVADSISQCKERGEISKALAKGAIKESKVIELGHLIEHPELAKRSDHTISISDLTGVAVQDVQIATAVCDALKK